MNIKLLLHHPLQWLRDLQSSPSHKQAPSVALVLSGGGARGLAQIGAIEELQARGNHIHAVAGTSMGALVGGFFCCGKLGLLKTKVLSLKRKEVMQLIDFSIGLDHVATADHLLTLMQQLLDNVRIENLPINFCCCASDLTSGRERVFREGPLADAIEPPSPSQASSSPCGMATKHWSTAACTTFSHSTASSESLATCSSALMSVPPTAVLATTTSIATTKASAVSCHGCAQYCL